ncbi:hypothetical protein DLP05_068 [Stenotrophomonas phage vB_SmaS_DLP_5]|uniref:Uncharacterized protein n=1 Tax=Stenotrophomonas phage vB_SmaS_DLP_5 TaxID=2044561 RepID=A0A2D2W2P7_9CAUD|nr:hypothetical protein FDJ07_gp067 [Stenotrophomonas phage vB_SmaS_DLP_5]ATS92411.1 hypothetical protein DLP05_068 [Stenotrophomonas phage vB_SmaS_DLP_5]
MKKPAIKFKAAATTTVGSTIRYFHKGYKFWEVSKIEDGVATAVAVSSPSGCC